jgi:hypothetical protein
MRTKHTLFGVAAMVAVASGCRVPSTHTEPDATEAPFVIVGNVAPADVTMQRAPLGRGPVVVVTEGDSGHSGKTGEALHVATAGEEGPARELLRTRPDLSLFVVHRLDQQRLLCLAGRMFPSRLFVVDAEGGTCRDLDADAARGFHVVGPRIVFAKDTAIGCVDWRTTNPPLVIPVPPLRDLQRVGDVVYGLTDHRAVRVCVTDGTMTVFGPTLTSAASLAVSPDGRQYAIGRWAERPPHDIEGPAAEQGRFDGVSFGSVAVHDMATDERLDEWDDEPIRTSSVSSRLGYPTTCQWLDGGLALRHRVGKDHRGHHIEQVARHVASGEEGPFDRSMVARSAEPLYRDHSRISRRASDGTIYAPPRPEPHPFRSPDRQWTADDVRPLDPRSDVEMVRVADGARRLLGEFAVSDIRWLPEVSTRQRPRP